MSLRLFLLRFSGFGCPLSTKTGCMHCLLQVGIPHPANRCVSLDWTQKRCFLKQTPQFSRKNVVGSGSPAPSMATEPSTDFLPARPSLTWVVIKRQGSELINATNTCVHRSPARDRATNKL